jgi:hypothetical protein
VVGGATFVAGGQREWDAHACWAEGIEHEDEVSLCGLGAAKLAQLVLALIGLQEFAKGLRQ